MNLISSMTFGASGVTPQVGSTSNISYTHITVHIELSPYSSLLYHRLVSMSFVKLSIFGTSFEVRSHLPCLSLQPSHSPIPGYHKICRSPTRRHGSVIPLILHPACPPLTSFKGAFGLVWYASLDTFLVPTTPTPYALFSSAKDQLTGASVAIKKIMKPFSTPVLSKRTYRELKLLKHIQHENVGTPKPLFCTLPIPSSPQIISLSDVFISPLEDMWVFRPLQLPPCLPLLSRSSSPLLQLF